MDKNSISSEHKENVRKFHKIWTALVMQISKKDDFSSLFVTAPGLLVYTMKLNIPIVASNGNTVEPLYSRHDL